MTNPAKRDRREASNKRGTTLVKQNRGESHLILALVLRTGMTDLSEIVLDC